MVNKVKVSAVSYTNTKPFIYGFQHDPEIANWMELSLDIPADCADKLLQHKVDVGLVPVATLAQLDTYEIISDYCIGADGAVNSVFILSDVPIHEIKILQLDAESRTSNQLAQILLKYFWKVPMPNFQQNAHAKVLIGDRTFGITSNYAYVYDLAEIWKQFTGLPFVFAVWIAHQKLPNEFLFQFNKSLALGLQNRLTLLAELPKISNFDLEDYLMHKIDYVLNEDKREGLRLFLDYMQQMANEKV